MSLMREVEWREKAAEKAKQEVDNCTLDINLEMDELIMAQQHVKELNDKHAKEVYAQRVELATEMKELQSCVSGVLNDGDGCVATIDEMCKALEKRLISAITKKEAADKDKLGKELALAYQKSQMEKLATESKRLEQEAMENLKLQKFLIDRGHVLNVLQEDMSCRCQDVKILKAELEDCQDVTEDYLRPIIQGIPLMHDCEGYKCCNILKGANGRTAAASREEMGTTKTVKSRINDLEVIQGLAESYMDQLDEGKQARIEPNLKHVYKENQMEKLVEESKILEQQATENFELPEFLHLIEMSEDSQDESEISVTEDYLRPIIQERIPMQDCESYKCSNILEGVNGRFVAGREMRTNTIIKSQMNDSEMKPELADSHTDQLNKVKWARTGPYLTLAYQESEMEKLVEESPGLEPEAMEILKLQEFLTIKEMPEDSPDESEISVTEDYMRPIVQEKVGM